MLERARQAGVRAVVCNATSEKDWEQVADLAARYPEVVPCFGIHPWYLARRSDGWRERLVAILQSHPRACVGEIGLDRWKPDRDEKVQEELFRTQLEHLLEGTDGQRHSLADLKGRDTVVVVFTCNSCPAAVGYEDRLLAFAKANPDVAIVAINVNTQKDDQLPAMKKRAEKKQFPFPYLYDPSQEIARKYGATYTPEFFVLNRDRKVVYCGAMDDRSPPAKAMTDHLTAAAKAAQAGTKPPAETLARGCRIRYNRAE